MIALHNNKDVDDEFCTMLERVVENEQAHIAFSGHFETFAEQMEKFPLLKERCTHIGFQDDIMAVYNISDAFLNPNRKGGGSAIVYAMQADLPVLSLPFGDAGMAASAFPSLEDYTAMAQKALELVERNYSERRNK